MKLMDYVNVFLSSLLGFLLAVFIYSYFFKQNVYVVDIYKLSAVDGYPVNLIFNSIKQKGYKGLVLDRNMVIYAPDAVDITDDIENYLKSNINTGGKQ
ncbi:MAG: hypothetical protein ACK4J2_07555 [Sulfurihydrogenibium azorense]|jgi:hypothetical protein|uniref:hypothetical protein n=1 Tax=Sulfurihydrogenibium azorense TaxID=309806 RepID=UPI00391A0867